jgi:hypothetical protein
MVNSRYYLWPTTPRSKFCKPGRHSSTSRRRPPSSQSPIHPLQLHPHSQCLVSSERSSRRLSVCQLRIARAPEVVLEQIANEAPQPALCGLSTSPVCRTPREKASTKRIKEERAWSMVSDQLGCRGAMKTVGSCTNQDFQALSSSTVSTQLQTPWQQVRARPSAQKCMLRVAEADLL